MDIKVCDICKNSDRVQKYFIPTMVQSVYGGKGITVIETNELKGMNMDLCYHHATIICECIKMCIKINENSKSRDNS